jgi:hypothetical protein
MSGALLYESLKESEAKEAREVSTKELEARESEFEPSKEMWVY